MRTSGGSCKHGNEPRDTIQCGEFFYLLRKYYPLKKNSVPWRHSFGWLVGYLVTLFVIRKLSIIGGSMTYSSKKKTWPRWQDSSPSFAVRCVLYAINLGALHRSDERRELFCFFLTSRRWDLMNIWSTKRFQVISRADYSQRKCCRMKGCCMTIPFSFSWGCLTL